MIRHDPLASFLIPPRSGCCPSAALTPVHERRWVATNLLPARTLLGGRARLLCRDAPCGEEREQRDPGEHDQRSAKTVEPCLLVDVEDRLGGFPRPRLPCRALLGDRRPR